MEKSVEQVLNNTVQTIKPILDNQVIILVIASVIILNVIHSLDSLPEKVKMVLVNPITKVGSVFASIYYITGDMKMTLIWTVAVIAVYNLFFFIKENFGVITNTPTVYPGCQNAKVSDLLALYNGDLEALKRGMYELSIPLNLTLTDENAGLIATYLINHGKNVSESCRQPM
jgi:hypothetical protein